MNQGLFLMSGKCKIAVFKAMMKKYPDGWASGNKDESSVEDEYMSPVATN